MRRGLLGLLGTATALLAAGAALGARPASAWLREEIQRILAQPEYQQPDPTLFQRMLEKIVRWLDQFAWGERVFALKEAAPLLYWGIVGLLVSALLLLVYHVFITIRLALQRAEPRRAPARAEGGESPASLRDRALALAATGDFAQALEVLHRALAALLDRHDLLRDDPALTNWERARALATRPSLAQELEALARRLDVLWYGDGRTDEHAWRACLDSVNRAWAIAEASE